MPEDETIRRCRAAAHHMLVAPANVGRYDFQNHAVLALAISKGELWIVDRLYFNATSSHVCDAAIRCHDPSVRLGNHISFLQLGIRA